MWKQLYSKLEVNTNFVVKRQTKVLVSRILTSQCVSMSCVPNCITTTTIAPNWWKFLHMGGIFQSCGIQLVGRNQQIVHI